MKERRHHNNKGLRQAKTGKTTRDLENMCKRLGLLFVSSDYYPNPMKEAAE